MKYKPLYWILFTPFIKRYLKKNFDAKAMKTIFKNAKAEYKRLLNKFDDIGSKNPMQINVYFVLLFLSFLTGNKERVTEPMLAEMLQSIFDSPGVNQLIRWVRFDLNEERYMTLVKNRLLRASEWAKNHSDQYPGT